MLGFVKRVLLSPDEFRLRAGWRMLLHALLMVFLFLAFGTVIGGIALLTGAQLNPNSLVFSQILNFLAITVSVYLARRWFDRRTFTSLGFGWDRQAGLDLVAGMLIPAVMLGLVFLLEWALGWLRFDSFAWQTKPLVDFGFELAIILGVFLLVGWQEELLARGYWLQNLSEGLNLFWGVLISSGVFGLQHLSNPNSSWMGVVGICATGVFLAYAYLRTRRLWLPIGLHIGLNIFEGPVFGFPVSGIAGLPHLVQQEVNGPSLWTGGEFGPEAGLVLIPALLVGAVLVYFYSGQLVIPEATEAGA